MFYGPIEDDSSKEATDINGEEARLISIGR
jgi:hypothetical protein